MSIVYDKPVTLQKQVAGTGAWEDVQHLHAEVNKSISQQFYTPESDRVRQRLVFKIRYNPVLESVRSALQDYRMVYRGQHFELVDYDDYKEHRREIKLIGELYELPVVIQLLIPTTTVVLGAPQKVYPESGAEIDCAWEGMTPDERKVNGLVSVVDRAKITIRTRSEVAANCAVKCADGSVWEIIGSPEDTGLSDRWSVFYVRRISGGA